jgi:protein-disulfide isomerase
MSELNISNMSDRFRMFKRALLAGVLLACLASEPRAQDVQKVTVAGQQSVLAKPVIEAPGARNPDISVVEYFDYNCPYCKRFAPTLQALSAADRKISLIYKEWPILGEVSVYAARSALAAQWQGKYFAAHDALMSGPRLAKDDQVDAALGRAGLDMAVLAKDRTQHAQEITAQLARIDSEANKLGIRGTPGIMVGRLLLPGIAELSDLQKLVTAVRREQ